VRDVELLPRRGGYHGCDRSVGENVLLGKEELATSGRWLLEVRELVGEVAAERTVLFSSHIPS